MARSGRAVQIAIFLPLKQRSSPATRSCKVLPGYTFPSWGWTPAWSEMSKHGAKACAHLPQNTVEKVADVVAAFTVAAASLKSRGA